MKREPAAGELQRKVRLYRPTRDEAVSTAMLYQYMERQAEWLDSIRPVISPEAFNLAAHLVEGWNEAVQQSKREYVSTAHAATLTGWSEETLRRHAKMSIEDRGSLPKGWAGILAHHTAGNWHLCLSSVPRKGA